MTSVRDSKNLRMVQRFDKEAESIVEQTLFVAVYRYQEDGGSWERESIEGPLFLLERGVEPKYSLLVVNRASATNFLKCIRGDFEFDDTGDYLMFRCEDGVYGLWFPDVEEKKKISQRIESIVSRMKKLENSEAEKMPKLLQEMFMSESATKGQVPPPPESFSGPGGADNFVLGKEQMKDVLLRLIQTDKFIDILHNTYLKSRGGPAAAPMQSNPGNHPVAPSPIRQNGNNMYHMPPGAAGGGVAWGRPPPQGVPIMHGGQPHPMAPIYGNPHMHHGQHPHPHPQHPQQQNQS
eukprot:CAMPEP_0203759198 /NCGR_PEP_ID=MMETSP0098-20131031/12178_1 /ASSEMBLY_ACC=CAM_ASM_000208 /TAXON_ID=96639 /ORGANISM=" , Strain NY0313808BC1" /LENGTH=292 /DNA_ID=CAMNT_0050652009 /DNA_START=154 /DNA_END=1032 /DNA_ORIENTATION=-